MLHTITHDTDLKDKRIEIHDELMFLMAELNKAEAEYNVLQQAREEAKSKILLENADDPKKLGANAEIREANIDKLLKAEYAALNGVDENIKLLKYKIVLCKETIRTLEFLKSQ